MLLTSRKCHWFTFLLCMVIVAIYADDQVYLINSAGSNQPNQNHAFVCYGKRREDEGMKYNWTIRELRKQKISTAWLPIKKISFGKWKWTDGSIYAQTIGHPATEKKGIDCAVLRSGDKMFVDVYCNNTYNHIMCVSTANCNKMEDIETCIIAEEGRYNYIIHTYKGTWFEAKARCFYLNSTLAYVPDKHIDFLLNKVAFPGRKIWIGLRKMDYFYTEGKWTEVKQYFWAKGGPKETTVNKSCVVMHDLRQSRNYYWKPAKCKSTFKFNCTDSTENPAKTTATYRINAGVIIGILFCIIILGAVAVIFLLKREHIIGQWNKWKSGTSNGKLEKDQAHPLNQLPAGDDDDDNEHNDTVDNLHREISPVDNESSSTEIVQTKVAIHPGERETTPENATEKYQEPEIRENHELLQRAVFIRGKLAEGLPRSPLNILLVGQKGAGKSSLINSLHTVLDKTGYHEFTDVGIGPVGGYPITTTLKRIPMFATKKKEYKDEEKWYCKPVFWDLPGLLNSDQEDILKYVLSGNCPEGRIFNNISTPMFGGKENKERRIHLILYVQSIEVTEAKQLIKSVYMAARGNRDTLPVRVIVVFNKMDKLVEGDIATHHTKTSTIDPYAGESKDPKNTSDEKNIKLLTRKEAFTNLETKVLKLFHIFNTPQRSFQVTSYAKETSFVDGKMKRITSIDRSLCDLWDAIIEDSHYTEFV